VLRANADGDVRGRQTNLSREGDRVTWSDRHHRRTG